MDPILISFRKSLDSPPHFRQLTKVHCTFANTSSGISPIGEIPWYFRQYTPRTFAIGECLIGESLIGENPATLVTLRLRLFWCWCDGKSDTTCLMILVSLKNSRSIALDAGATEGLILHLS